MTGMPLLSGLMAQTGLILLFRMLAVALGLQEPPDQQARLVPQAQEQPGLREPLELLAPLEVGLEQQAQLALLGPQAKVPQEPRGQMGQLALMGQLELQALRGRQGAQVPQVPQVLVQQEPRALLALQEPRVQMEPRALLGLRELQVLQVLVQRGVQGPREVRALLARQVLQVGRQVLQAPREPLALRVQRGKQVLKALLAVQLEPLERQGLQAQLAQWKE